MQDTLAVLNWWLSKHMQAYLRCTLSVSSHTKGHIKLGCALTSLYSQCSKIIHLNDAVMIYYDHSDTDEDNFELLLCFKTFLNI